MNYLSTDDIGHIDSESERSINRDHSHSYAYFSDGCRRVDYVLVYQEIDENNDDERITACCSGNETVPELMLMVSNRHDESRRREARHIFENNLRRKGLQLEDIPGKFCKGLRFVLVHAPFELLTTQAEKLGIEMPVKSSTYKNHHSCPFGSNQFLCPQARELRTVIKGPLDKLLEQCEFFFFDDEIEELMKAPLYQNALFTKDCLDCFVGSEDEEEFFSSAERVMIVHDILSRARFGEGDLIGIECILSREVYTAAYPLHEYLDYENLRPGVCSCEPRKTAAELKTATTRQLLYWTWTKFQYFYKFQPLYLIKKYFGSKIGMYFILLGYYTKYLIPTSAIGVLCFYYGLLSLHADIPR
ncbi:hypothetical protein AB6A40_003775 [Gnathostoma spinigerum]|uniref:Anoctamin n=1 Tax=Gnathostoma spinigerum TaxID=75299 RepID=A0ABD6EI53_9BILA